MLDLANDLETRLLGYIPKQHSQHNFNSVKLHVKGILKAVTKEGITLSFITTYYLNLKIQLYIIYILNIYILIL